MKERQKTSKTEEKKSNKKIDQEEINESKIKIWLKLNNKPTKIAPPTKSTPN